LKAPLLPALVTAGKETGAHLQACAAALMAKQRAPSRAPLDLALTRFMAGIETLRREGHLRELPVEAVERLFATGFALEQMRGNLQDLDRCVDEWAARRG